MKYSMNIIIVVGVVAVLVGGALGYVSAMAMNNDTVSKKDAEKTDAVAMAKTTARTDTKTPAADLRVLLNGLEREHVDLASTAVRNGFDGSADFAASAAQLDLNSVGLADAVGSIYGTPARDQFLAIWRSHIGFFVDYTLGAKAGDKAKMDKAVSNLGGYIDAVSDFFSTANPNLPKDAVKQLVTDHVTLLKAAVDTYGAKDFTGSYAKQHDAYNQIGTIADAISGAIVKQKPELFK